MRTLSVLAQNATDGLYYPGYIHTNSPEDETVTVNFYSLRTQEVPREKVIVVGGSAPCPNLVAGDYVLVQVQYKATWAVLYVPGVVLAPPKSRDYFTKNFLVQLFTHVIVERPRRLLVKIGQNQHSAMLEFIRELYPHKNPMLRLEPESGGSIFRRRKLLRRSTAFMQSPIRPRKEISHPGRTQKSLPLQKAKERKLLTASLRSSSNSFRPYKGRQNLPKRYPSSKALKITDGQMQFLRDIVTSNGDKTDVKRNETDRSLKSNRSANNFAIIKNKVEKYGKSVDGEERKKKTSRKEKPEISSSISKTGDFTVESKGVTANSEDRSAKKKQSVEDDMVLQDIEDEFNDNKDSVVERQVSPTYSDTFESGSSRSKISDRSGDSRVSTDKSTVSEGDHKETCHTSSTVHAQETEIDHSYTTDSKKSRRTRTSSQSLSRHSHTTSQGTSKRTSRRQTPIRKDNKNRRHSIGSDSFSDVTNSSTHTITNDIIGQGEEVLARWSDDGWYYFGLIITEIGDDKYVVKDVTGYKETINRRDILIDSEQAFQVLQPGDSVIGLHPNYVFSYAPGKVKDVYPNTGVTVEFYDRTTARLPATEVYKIRTDKYRTDVQYIRQCEEKLCDAGNTVIAREDRTGLYLRCQVECPTNVNQSFFIRLPDMTFAKQSSIHIFTFPSRDQRRDHVHQFVLAPADRDSSIYLPASVIQYRPFCVQFCDGTISTDIQPSHCFNISNDYYKNATSYFFHIQATIKKTDESRNRISPWQQKSSDSWSENSGPRDSYLTSRMNGGGDRSSLENRSDSTGRKQSITKNLVHNPSVLEFRRKLKLRHTSINAEEHIVSPL